MSDQPVENLETASVTELSALLGVRVAQLVDTAVAGKHYSDKIMEVAKVAQALNPEFNSLAFGLGGLTAPLG